jgi:hypothetical protein
VTTSTRWITRPRCDDGHDGADSSLTDVRPAGDDEHDRKQKATLVGKAAALAGETLDPSKRTTAKRVITEFYERSGHGDWPAGGGFAIIYPSQ